MLFNRLCKIICLLLGFYLLLYPISIFSSTGNSSTGGTVIIEQNHTIKISNPLTDKLDGILSKFYENLDLKITLTQTKIDYIYSLYGKINAVKNRSKIKGSLTDSQKFIFSYLENSLEQKISFYQLKLLDEETERIALEKAKNHVKKPDKVKSLYYTSYAAGNTKKMNALYSLIDNTEINSVTIDIKDVSGYVSFKLDHDDFDKIKPITNNRINNIKEVINELHKKDIYVIGRIVVFKDKLLAVNRPDLAIKWTDQKTVWNDYAGNKYMDPYSKEVWDYNANIANASYDLGFDELNFDYVRFPSDGKISSTYYPYAKAIIKDNPKWGKIMVIDKFSHYFTQRMREKEPDIILSADVFGLVTRIDLLQIGQNLESFMLNFDYVGPMVYPSHYGRSFLGYSPADNYPYEIILDAFKHSKSKVDALNTEIELAKYENRKIKINPYISSDIDVNEVTTIELGVIRPWLQGFTCTRCPGATEYNRYKFRRQIQAANDYDIDSWWVWNSGSNYYSNRFNK